MEESKVLEKKSTTLSMKDSLKMTSIMGMVVTSILMEITTLEIGLTGNGQDGVSW